MRVGSARGGLHVATLLIGGIAALVGLTKGLLVVSGFLFVGLMMGTNPYLYLLLGSEGTCAVSGALGLVGVGLTAAGRCLTGVSLMLVGAVGVAASALLYTLLLPSVMPPEQYVGPPSYPSAFAYVVWLAPVPALLIAAALAFFARGTEG